MCKCDSRILNPYCGNGTCQYPEIETRAKSMAMSYGCILPIPAFDTVDQWITALNFFKEVGLEIIPIKELKKLENFHAKIHTAIHDYPNY